MTVIDLPTAEAAPAITSSVSTRWTARAAALTLDLTPGAAVLATTAIVALSVPLHEMWWWVCISVGAAVMLVVLFNGVLLPVFNGQSLGRAVFGIGTSSASSPQLGNGRRRRLRRYAAGWILIAAALCASGAAVSYWTVRQRDMSIIDATAKASAEGPRMIAQLLSYDPITIQTDFDRARSFATDGYRVKLSAQQDAVRQMAPVRNEYWVTSDAVVDASQDRVTMLLFLQGQRGDAPHQRYITASVRAAFTESGSRLLVDDITVISKSEPAQTKP